MSHNEEFHFLHLYWAFNEKPTCLIKYGLHLDGEGAGILGDCVSIARQVHLWTKRSQTSFSGNKEGIPPPMGAP